jgi:hypothetical protein
MAIVTTGLELSLDASNPASYSGTGTLWNDLSGNSNNFILANSPYWNSRGYFAMGATQYAYKFGVANLTRWAAADYTVCYWVYNTSFTSGVSGTNFPSGVGNSAPDSNTQYWTFGTDSTGLVKLYYFNGSPQFMNTTTTLSLNTWNHLTLTQSGGVVNIYVNGSLVNTATIVGTPQYSVDAHPLSFSGQSGAYINGALFTAQIYEIALNGTQVLQNYSAAVPPSPDGVGLVSQTSVPTLIQTSSVAAVYQSSAPVLVGANPDGLVSQTSVPALINAIPDSLVSQSSIAVLSRLFIDPNIYVDVVGVDATAILGEVNAFAQSVTLTVFGVAGFGSVNPVGSVFTTRNVIIDPEFVVGFGRVVYPTIRWNNVEIFDISDWNDVPHQRGSNDY